jgi:integrase/recombinase XerD
MQPATPLEPAKVRGQKAKANGLQAVIRETARLWRKAHLDYDYCSVTVNKGYSK